MARPAGQGLAGREGKRLGRPTRTADSDGRLGRPLRIGDRERAAAVRNGRRRGPGSSLTSPASPRPAGGAGVGSGPQRHGDAAGRVCGRRPNPLRRQPGRGPTPWPPGQCGHAMARTSPAARPGPARRRAGRGAAVAARCIGRRQTGRNEFKDCRDIAGISSSVSFITHKRWTGRGTPQCGLGSGGRAPGGKGAGAVLWLERAMLWFGRAMLWFGRAMLWLERAMLWLGRVRHPRR